MPRGLAACRPGDAAAGGAVGPHTADAAAVPSPAEVDALLAALRTRRDQGMVEAMLLGGLRCCEFVGLRMADVRHDERRLFVAEGKGGRQRIAPVPGRFFATLGGYLEQEPPRNSTPGGSSWCSAPRRGQPLSALGWTRVGGAGRAGPGELPPAAPHLLHPPAGGPAHTTPPAEVEELVAAYRPTCSARAWSPTTRSPRRPDVPVPRRRGGPVGVVAGRSKCVTPLRDVVGCPRTSSCVGPCTG